MAKIAFFANHGHKLTWSIYDQYSRDLFFVSMTNGNNLYPLYMDSKIFHNFLFVFEQDIFKFAFVSTKTFETVLNYIFRIELLAIRVLSGSQTGAFI